MVHTRRIHDTINKTVEFWKIMSYTCIPKIGLPKDRAFWEIDTSEDQTLAKNKKILGTQVGHK